MLQHLNAVRTQSLRVLHQRSLQQSKIRPDACVHIAADVHNIILLEHRHGRIHGLSG